MAISAPIRAYAALRPGHQRRTAFQVQPVRFIPREMQEEGCNMGKTLTWCLLCPVPRLCRNAPEHRFRVRRCLSACRRILEYRRVKVNRFFCLAADLAHEHEHWG